MSKVKVHLMAICTRRRATDEIMTVVLTLTLHLPIQRLPCEVHELDEMSVELMTRLVSQTLFWTVINSKLITNKKFT